MRFRYPFSLNAAERIIKHYFLNYFVRTERKLNVMEDINGALAWRGMIIPCTKSMCMLSKNYPRKFKKLLINISKTF